MNHLIQLLLPLYDNDQKPFSPELFARVKAGLTEEFGGLTAYTRSPAEGQWKDSERDVRDEIVVYEVMADEIDADWWGRYRQMLEKSFSQDEIIVRALLMRRL